MAPIAHPQRVLIGSLKSEQQIAHKRFGSAGWTSESLSASASLRLHLIGVVHLKGFTLSNTGVGSPDVGDGAPGVGGRTGLTVA